MTMATVVEAMDGLLRIESGSAEPPFEQVRRQLADAVGDGRLAAGTRLPPIRALADELGLATNTVARAYRELEAAGLVLTRGRAGTVVSPDAATGGASRDDGEGRGGGPDCPTVSTGLEQKWGPSQGSFILPESSVKMRWKP